MLSLGRGRNSRAAESTPGDAGVVGPSTSDDVDAADSPVALDGDDPTTPYNDVAAVGAPVIQDTVDPAITDAVAPASSGDGNHVVLGAGAPKCDGDPMMPSTGAPITSRVCAPRVQDDVVLRRRYWCLFTMFSFSKPEMGLDRCPRNSRAYPVALSDPAGLPTVLSP